MATDGADDATDPVSDPATDDAKTHLRRLAGIDGAAVVEHADAATEDLDAAVEFVEAVGLRRLARTVDAADDSEVARRGERALAKFRRFRAAAAGEAPAEHFRPGHDIDLRDGAEATTE